MGRNRASLHFKTEGVADTALSAPRFWPTSARFAGAWGIFSTPGDPKLTSDCLGFQWNGQSETFWTLTLELLDRNIAPLYVKTERVAETVLRKSWYWPTSGRFTGTWLIYSISAGSKLTPASLGFQWNGQRKAFWTLSLQLLGRNRIPLHFQTEIVAETASRASWVTQVQLDFTQLLGYFPVRGTLN